jgi:coenzyme F420-0:L-glutamate ligase/coenzyme F420-1:gamma-L-glutamate ligase
MWGIPGIPEVRPGDDLAAIIGDGIVSAGLKLGAGDVLVLCQKIVSKAEGRFASLVDVQPSVEAVDMARLCEKDPRLVQIILDQTERVVRCEPGILIVRNHLGLTMANAGVDQSNIPMGDEHVLLLPEAPDVSAGKLRDALRQRFNHAPGIVISDSSGRAWRNGVIGLCIGCAGLAALEDRRGEPDRFGRPLAVTQVAIADQIASAAALITGEGSEGLPVVIISGLSKRWLGSQGRGSELVRPADQDLFL